MSIVFADVVASGGGPREGEMWIVTKSYMGPDRRRGRPMYTRGPVALTLEAITVVTALIAIAALVISITFQQQNINDIQTQRARAAQDTCMILRKLVIASGAATHRLTQAQLFLYNNGLGNCLDYASKVTHSP